MPYKSEAQRKWMHANHPDIASRWDIEYPETGKLPEHVADLTKKKGKHKMNKQAFFEGFNSKCVSLNLDPIEVAKSLLKQAADDGKKKDLSSLISRNSIGGGIGGSLGSLGGLIGAMPYMDTPTADNALTSMLMTTGGGLAGHLAGTGVGSFFDKDERLTPEQAKMKSALSSRMHAMGTLPAAGGALGALAGYMLNPSPNGPDGVMSPAIGSLLGVGGGVMGAHFGFPNPIAKIKV